MTLPNNPFSAPSGVPQPSREPSEASSLPAPTSAPSLPVPTGAPSLAAPTGAPVMVAPAADPFGAAPLHTGAVSSARSSRSMHGRIAAWMLIVCQSISLVHGFIPYHFDHLDDYVSRFSNPMFWLWRLMEIVVITLAVLYIRKGSAIARYVAACVILVLFFVVTPIVFVTNDSDWYYAFVPEPGLYELGLLGARLLLMRALDWICVIAAILLAIPDFKPAPSPYAMSAPVPAGGAAPAGHVASPSMAPEGASSEAAPEASSAQATNVSGFAAPQ